MRRTSGAAAVLATAVVMAAMVAIPAGADESSGESRAARPPLTVATFNVLSARSGVAWKPRRAGVLAMIKQTKADVIVLQEADWKSSHLYERPRDIKARTSPALWLARKSGRRLAATTGYTGPISSIGLWVNRQGPHVLYNPRRVTQLTYRGDQDAPAGSGYATFLDRATGKPFRIGTIHLEVGSTPTIAQARLDELALLDEQIRQFRSWGDNHEAPMMIWAGDFNSTDRSLVRAMHRRGVVDSVKIARKRTQHRVNTFKGRGRAVHRTGVRIDQIWVPKGSRVDSWTQLVNIKKGKYVGRFVSDHNPVVAKVVLPG